MSTPGLPGTVSGTPVQGPITQALAKDAAIKASRMAEMTRRMAGESARWVERLKEMRRWGRFDEIKNLQRLYPKQVAEASRTIATRQAAARALVLAEAEAVAAEGTLLTGYGIGTTVAIYALPIVGMIAVGLALGAGLYQAREAAKKEEFASGFARGFVMGLLKWTWDWAVARFPPHFKPNPFDPDMHEIQATAYLDGMQQGFLAGTAMTKDMKKLYLLKLRQLSGASTAGWEARSFDQLAQELAKRVQINFVVEMAGAARKHGLIAEGKPQLEVATAAWG